MVERFFHYLQRYQVIFALAIVVLAWFIFQIRGILVSIFIAYILMAALMPFVNALRKLRFPKLLSVLIPYLGLIIIVFLLIVPVIPLFIDQVRNLLAGLPAYLDKSALALGIQIDPKELQTTITSQLNTIGSNAVAVTSSVFGGFFSTITVLIVSFYFLMYHEKFKMWIASLFHKNSHEKVLTTLQQVDDKLGAWFRGQVVLCFFIGFVTYIALSLLSMPYAVPLAVIAGILEVVPTLGPTLSAVPSIIVALTISPTMAVIVVVTYMLIQQFENSFLVPKIMQRAVGLNPVVVIIAIMIGANLMGVAGALLAIPFVSFIIVLFNSISNYNQK